jgi:hypothetical protein
MRRLLRELGSSLTARMAALAPCEATVDAVYDRIRLHRRIFSRARLSVASISAFDRIGRTHWPACKRKSQSSASISCPLLNLPDALISFCASADRFQRRPLTKNSSLYSPAASASACAACVAAPAAVAEAAESSSSSSKGASATTWSG